MAPKKKKQTKGKSKPKSKGKGKKAGTRKSSWINTALAPEPDYRKYVFLATAIGAGILGAHALGNGRAGVITSLAIAGIGGASKNMYLTATGLSMLGTISQSSTTTPVIAEDEVNGLSAKNLVSGAKTRIGAYFNTFKDKFRLSTPANPTTVNGLGSPSQVYRSVPSALNMSQLDTIEKQIESMNGMDTDHLEDLPIGKEL